MTDTLQPTDNRTERLNVLRAVIDWLDERPGTIPNLYDGRVLHSVWTREDFVEAMRAIGGKWIKSVDDGGYFNLTQPIAPGWTYQLYVARDVVCERVQTGEREVEVPDPEKVAELPRVKTTEPVYEWRCPDSLLAEVTA